MVDVKTRRGPILYMGRRGWKEERRQESGVGIEEGVKGVGSKTGLVREREMKVNINSAWEGEGDGVRSRG